jgi:hypothetical protein
VVAQIIAFWFEWLAREGFPQRQDRLALVPGTYTRSRAGKQLSPHALSITRPTTCDRHGHAGSMTFLLANSSAEEAQMMLEPLKVRPQPRVHEEGVLSLSPAAWALPECTAAPRDPACEVTLHKAASSLSGLELVAGHRIVSGHQAPASITLQKYKPTCITGCLRLGARIGGVVWGTTHGRQPCAQKAICMDSELRT